MKAKAQQCEQVADSATDRLTVHTFRELAAQWRDMASQVDQLERSAFYRAVRKRPKVVDC